MSSGVSVCIAARNEQASIEGAIGSAARACSAIDHEIIVCANGCTDETEAVVTACTRRWPQVRLISTPTPGKPNAWNLLLREARYDLLAYMDADVLLDPDSIRILADRLRESSSLVATGATCVSRNRHDDFLSRLLSRGIESHGCLVGRLYVVHRDRLAERFRDRGLAQMDPRIIAEDYWLTMVIGAGRWTIVDSARVFYLQPHWRELRETDLRNTCGTLQVRRLYPDLYREQRERVPRKLSRWFHTLARSARRGVASRRIVDFALRCVWRERAIWLERAAARRSSWSSLWRTAPTSKSPSTRRVEVGSAD